MTRLFIRAAGLPLQQQSVTVKETASSNSRRAPTSSLVTGVSDSISQVRLATVTTCCVSIPQDNHALCCCLQSNASEIKPRKPNHRARKAVEHQAQVPEVDLVGELLSTVSEELYWQSSLPCLNLSFHCSYLQPKLARLCGQAASTTGRCPGKGSCRQ